MFEVVSDSSLPGLATVASRLFPVSQLAGTTVKRFCGLLRGVNTGSTGVDLTQIEANLLLPLGTKS